jgi:hypothetical protein
MKKWANELNRKFLKKGGQIYEEICNIPGHEGNEIQNHIKTSP